MISAQMQPIRMGILSDLAPEVEAYMATYLAAYNNQAVSARMFQSYQRAWGLSDITMFPRVDGGRPGFVLLRWLEGSVKKCIVAIEGTTERTSWWTGAGGLTRSLPVAGLTGRYWGTAVTYADQIKTVLDGTGLFGAVLAQPNSCVEFAGFSLGAGIAEVLACRYRAANPLRQFFLYKFASPKFANANWVNNRSNRLPVKNVYYRRDPAHFLPSGGTRLSFSEGFLSNPLAESYVRDPVVTTYDEASLSTSSYFSTWIGGDIGTIANYYQTMDETNNWFWHDRNQYRYMYCTSVWVGNDVLAYRMLHLEHNDENTWQQNFLPGRGVQPDMLVMSMPDPLDVQPTGPSVIAAVQNPPPAQLVLPQQTGVTGFSEEPGDWGSSIPVASRRVRFGRVRRVGTP